MDKPAVVSLTFDDGLRCQFEQAVPILDRYGFPATFFIVANADPIFTDGFCEKNGFKWPKINWGKTDIRSLKGMIQRGHEIASHTVSHKDPSMEANPYFEVYESKRRIEEWLGIEVSSFGYPFYRTIRNLRAAVEKTKYRQARTGKENSFYSSPNSVDWLGVDCHQISRTGELVDKWVRPGCWHVLTFHGIGGERDGWEPITIVEFARQMAELSKHRASGAVEVLTFKDGADRLRQSSNGPSAFTAIS